MKLKIFLILLIILLSTFNIVCLIEIYNPVTVVKEGYLAKKTSKDNFTRCILTFKVLNQTVGWVEEDINSYYRYQMYNNFIITYKYGRITGKELSHNIESK